MLLFAVAFCLAAVPARGHAKGGGEAECKTHKHEEDCGKQDGCAWEDEECTEAAVSCAETTEKDKCTDSCSWNDDNNKCEDAAAECADKTSEEDCTGSCTW